MLKCEPDAQSFWNSTKEDDKLEVTPLANIGRDFSSREKLAPISEEKSTPEFCGKPKMSDKINFLDEQNKLVDIGLTAFKLISKIEHV